MSIRSYQGFTLVELMVVIGILGLMVGILAVAVGESSGNGRAQLETKQVADLMSDIQLIQTDPSKRKRMNSDSVKNTSGYRWYSIALKRNILSAGTLSKLVSLNTRTDLKADTSFFDSDEELDPLSCSYTAPKGRDILEMLSLRGKDRKVFLSFNSRNWNNRDQEVLVRWTDGQTAEYVVFEDLSDEYDIAREDWFAGEDLIGEKAPFDKTHDGR
ncbi:MAG: type II secretion system protein [Planctomycetota bacterium]|jgi:prepilin-type N-terminal cleavage/methylation domain-containing protein